MASQQDAAGPGVVRHADAGAGGECAGILLMPGADLPCAAIVRRAECIDQPVDPWLRVGERGPRARGNAKRNRFGTAFGGTAAQRLRRSER